METATRDKKKRKVHQGENIAHLRLRFRITQSDLANKAGVHQTVISDLEKKDTIDDATLDRIAAALEVPTSFIKEFDMDEAINSHINNVVYNEPVNTECDTVGFKQVENETINYYPIDKITELYERLIADKQKEVDYLKGEVVELKKR